MSFKEIAKDLVTHNTMRVINIIKFTTILLLIWLVFDWLMSDFSIQIVINLNEKKETIRF